MLRTKLVAASVAALALAAGPMTATPAAAQDIEVDVPCDAFRPPYDYPCHTAKDALIFVLDEAGDAITFVFAVRDEVGELAFRVFCTAFPEHPACQV